jgi:haloalkane dehalogenase
MLDDAGPALLFAEHRIPRGESSLYARDYAGAGPAFILMHGLPDNLLIYEELIPYLVAAGRRVITFDFLGYGGSDKPDGATYSYKQQLSDLEAVVETLDPGKVVLVPHDSAGMAAVNFAVEHPEKVAAMRILNCGFDNSGVARWPDMITLFGLKSLDALAQAFVESPVEFRWLLDWTRTKFGEPLTPQQREHFEAVIGPVVRDNFLVQPSSGPAFIQLTADFFAELDRNSARLPLVEALDIPVKIIWGEHDPYLNADMGRAFATHFKNATLDMVPGGHWLQSDEAEMVAKLMLQD